MSICVLPLDTIESLSELLVESSIAIPAVVGFITVNLLRKTCLLQTLRSANSFMLRLTSNLLTDSLLVSEVWCQLKYQTTLPARGGDVSVEGGIELDDAVHIKNARSAFAIWKCSYLKSKIKRETVLC